MKIANANSVEASGEMTASVLQDLVRFVKSILKQLNMSRSVRREKI